MILERTVCNFIYIKTRKSSENGNNMNKAKEQLGSVE